jgi:hypothetical protein
MPSKQGSRASRQVGVFISSVYDGLEEYRQAAIEAVHNCHFSLIAMEYENTAKSGTIYESSQQMVEDADVYVGIFAGRYGEVTAEELKWAEKRHIPRLIFWAKTRLNDADYEPDEEKMRQLAQLKAKLYKRNQVGEFSSPQELREKLYRSLVELRDQGQIAVPPPPSEHGATWWVPLIALLTTLAWALTALGTLRWPIWLAAPCSIAAAAVAGLLDSQRGKRGKMPTSLSLLFPAEHVPRDADRFHGNMRRRYQQWLADAVDGREPLELRFASLPNDVEPRRNPTPNDPLDPLKAGLDGNLQPTTSICQVYDRANRHLLILGELGGGKSTLLRRLALALMDETPDETAPLPVILSLASWSAECEKDRSLLEWVSEQVGEQYCYDSPPNADVARARFAHRDYLPLLDGLDEVEEKSRAACIAAINAFSSELKPEGLVVTSQLDAYRQAQPARLNMSAAVQVQPLDESQVYDYVERNGGVIGLRDTLTRDPLLLGALTTPLMLRLVLHAYAGLSVDALRAETDPQSLRHRVFLDYEDRMFHAYKARAWHSPGPDFAPQWLDQMSAWLRWLAGTMQGKTFYLDRLSSEWLPDSDLFRRYAVRIGAALAVGAGLASAIAGVLVHPALGLIYALIVGIVASWSVTMKIRPAGNMIRSGWRTVIGFFCGFLLGPIYGSLLLLLIWLAAVLPSTWIPEAKRSTVKGWARDLRAHLRGWGSLALISMLVLVALILLRQPQMIGRVAPDIDVRHPSLLVFHLAIRALIGVALALFAGRLPRPLDEGAQVISDWSIRQSLRNNLAAVLCILLIAVAGSTLYSLLISVTSARSVIASASLHVPLYIGFLTALGIGATLPYMGGLAVARHYLVRLRLRKYTYSPWHYERFLAHAVECGFLKRDGTGYRFLHPALREYFRSAGS